MLRIIISMASPSCSHRARERHDLLQLKVTGRTFLSLFFRILTHDSPVRKDIFHWNFPKPKDSSASCTVKVSVKGTRQNVSGTFVNVLQLKDLHLCVCLHIVQKCIMQKTCLT